MSPRLCFLWVALVLPQSASPQMSQTAPDNLPGATPRVEIPFNLYRDYLIVVQGSVGMLKPLNLLIATGANPSTVDQRIARKLGLKGEAGRVVLYQQNVYAEDVVLPRVRVGPIEAESVHGLIQDLSAVERIAGVRIDAIIGFDVLQQSSFIIDYDAKRIIAGPVETSELAVPFEIGPPNLTVQMEIQDQPVRLLLDTGATELLLFDCQLQDRLQPLSSVTTRPFLNSADTVFQTNEVRLPALRLGPIDLGVTKAFLVNDRADCGLPFDGVVGVRSLGFKWVAFDFEHRIFSWKR